MPKITKTHINRLIELEASVQYDESPPAEEKPFIVKDGKFPILISAPHGARTFRDNDKEVWHEEDEYTAGMAQLLGELCDVPVIATVLKNDDYDPNYVRDDNVAYKQAIRSMITENGVQFVIDLHGAGLNSETLASDQTIDLGYRGKKKHERSMDKKHIEKLERILQIDKNQDDLTCSIVDHNKFPAKGRGTITTFVFCRFGIDTTYSVQSIQIEIKPQLRVAHRFSTASLFPSNGKYDADPNCIIHMLQALVDFIEYLKEESK